MATKTNDNKVKSTKTNDTKKDTKAKAETKKVETKKDTKAKADIKKVDTKKTDTKKGDTKKADTKETKNGIYRVSYDAEQRKWLIKKDGAGRTIDSCVTKEEALKRVKELSKNQDVGFTVKKKDGKFQKKS